MIPSNSSINRLDPFLHSDNIICAGGRLRKSGLTEAEQHPIILPRKNAVSNVIIQWSHNSATHSARGLTLNHLWNNGIWIISANAAVQGIIHRCVACCKLQQKKGFEKMVHITVKRCTEATPFTYCRVDMFNPYLMKERSQLKRYGVHYLHVFPVMPYT